MSKLSQIRRRKAAKNVAIKKIVAKGILQERRIEAEHQINEAKALITSIQAEVASVPRS